jgi:hypothetical protein
MPDKYAIFWQNATAALGKRFLIPEDQQQYLLHHAAFLAYLKRDSDAYAPELAAQHAAIFSQAVGPSISAVDERRYRELSGLHVTSPWAGPFW